MKKIVILSSLLLTVVYGFAQKGGVEGLVVNPMNNEPVPFANVIICNTDIGTVTDSVGTFKISGLNPGFVQVQVSCIGFETTVSSEILITNAKKGFLEIKLNRSTTELKEVDIKASQFTRKVESPVSMRTIGIAEIEKSPGGNRDISKVIQSLPGVAGAASYRNDLIVRGGGPSENRFYLDGIEIPNLNHFATQGASGGPVGIINVDFIRSVDFYSGAFPADKGNALSSIIDFKLVDGNKEKMKYRATIGASDLALTLDGPLGPKTSVVFSARRSYLQFLFAALELPFLPTYNDFQFKLKSRLDEKNEITLIGLAAIDQSDLNLSANKTEEQRYILGYLPVYNQWNYTIGAVYKHYRENGYHSFVISRNHLNNGSYKYKNNIEVDSLKTLDYSSNEIETKLRYENNFNSENGYRFNMGADLQYAQYTNQTYQKVFLTSGASTINYHTDLGFIKWGAFGQVSKGLFDERLLVSLGIRADAANYSTQMDNLFRQVSPRLSLSYPISEKWSLNFNTGRYYQLPAYTSMGFRNQNGELINKQNGLTYLSVDHLVTGLEYLPNEKSKITLEGFYKRYHHYPFSVNDSIALSSKGGDYGTVGDEAVLSVGEGRSYGLELYSRFTDLFGFNMLLSYTWVRSEFKDSYGTYVPTSWDYEHLINLTATRKFKHNWDIGFKFRFAGGAPYTPDNAIKSSYVLGWDASGRAYPDYSKFNQFRLKSTHELDIRIDKGYFFDKWSLMLYVDVQNILNSKADTPDILTNLDANGKSTIINPDDPLSQQRYALRYLKTSGSGSILPTIGIMIEF